MTYQVLYNPKAGDGSGKETAEKLSKLLPGETVKLRDMTGVKSYREFFAGLSREDSLVLTGGDGTLNRFVNETEGMELPNEIYYFAAGTGNDFLRDVGTKKPLASIGKYLKNLPRVTVKGKTCRFLNGVGYGIDGYCCEVGDRLRETSKKPVNYTAIAIKGLLFHFKPANAVVTVDGKEHKFRKVWLAPTMNGRFYGGGMMVAPEQDRLDPEKKLTVMVMHGSGKLKTLMVFPTIFKGEHVKHREMCTVLTGHEITVKFDRPTALQIDGETVLGVTEYSAKAALPVKA